MTVASCANEASPSTGTDSGTCRARRPTTPASSGRDRPSSSAAIGCCSGRGPATRALATRRRARRRHDVEARRARVDRGRGGRADRQRHRAGADRPGCDALEGRRRRARIGELAAPELPSASSPRTPATRSASRRPRRTGGARRHRRTPRPLAPRTPPPARGRGSRAPPHRRTAPATTARAGAGRPEPVHGRLQRRARRRPEPHLLDHLGHHRRRGAAIRRRASAPARTPAPRPGAAAASLAAAGTWCARSRDARPRPGARPRGRSRSSRPSRRTAAARALHRRHRAASATLLGEEPVGLEWFAHLCSLSW